MANTLAVKSHSAKAQDRVIRVIIYVLLIVMAALMLVPFLWMLSASFKMNKDVFAFPIEWIPSNPRVRNYVDIWTKIPLLTFIFNTAKLTIIVTLLQLFTSSFAAYAFAKLNFKGKKNAVFGLYCHHRCALAGIHGAAVYDDAFLGAEQYPFSHHLLAGVQRVRCIFDETIL